MKARRLHTSQGRFGHKSGGPSRVGCNAGAAYCVAALGDSNRWRVLVAAEWAGYCVFGPEALDRNLDPALTACAG